MKRKVWAVAVLVAAVAAVVFVVLLRSGIRTEDTKILLDGKPLSDPVLSAAQEDLRVIVTLDGKEIANLPFGEEHTLKVIQPNGDENTVALTAESVYMESANCEGQDCVEMEKVTRDNLETRVMFGMIICLPHKVSVEVRET